MRPTLGGFVESLTINRGCAAIATVDEAMAAVDNGSYFTPLNAQMLQAPDGGYVRRCAGVVIGSPEVLKRTQGMYDVVRLMVYCPDFIGDMQTINQTVLLLLQNLGWDPDQPRVGAVVHYTGSDEFIKAMTYSLLRQRLPYYSLTLPRHNDRALEVLDHGLRQCTHAVEFVSRRAAKGEYVTQSQFNTLAYASGLSYLKFVLSE